MEVKATENREDHRQQTVINLIDWGYLLFVLLCSASFYIILVITLEVPLKPALIIGLTPVGVLALVILAFCVFSSYTVGGWRDNYNQVINNENYTRGIKAALLPLLLVALYFYIKEFGQETLHSVSPVTCEMIVHPCGSSYQQDKAIIWDSADLISQPSQSEVFIVTNIALITNQTRDRCPQTGAYCSTENIYPGRTSPKWLEKTSWFFAHHWTRAKFCHPVSCPIPTKEEEEPDEAEECPSGVVYDNGIQTSGCQNSLCVIDGWCPPIDLSRDFSSDPLFETENFTIFLDLKPNFPGFRGPSWTKGGAGGYSVNYADIYAKYHGHQKSISTCLYHPQNDPYCPRFKLEDIVGLANADEDALFTDVATYGGQFKIEVHWECGFDWGHDIYDCFPDFKFIDRATNKGKPKIYPRILGQDGDKRNISYSLGIHVSVAHTGKGSQIQLFNLVLYLQFIYVSYQMIKGPFLLIIRCVFATFFTIRHGGKLAV